MLLEKLEKTDFFALMQVLPSVVTVLHYILKCYKEFVHRNAKLCLFFFSLFC